MVRHDRAMRLRRRVEQGDYPVVIAAVADAILLSEPGRPSAALRAEIAGLLRDALARMDARALLVLQLAFVEEASVAEIAAIIGRPLAETAACRRRALRDLTLLLGGDR